MSLIRKKSLQQIRKFNKIFNKSDNITKKVNYHDDVNNLISVKNPLNSKVETYEDYIKESKYILSFDEYKNNSKINGKNI